MKQPTNIIEVERGGVIVLTPRHDLRELEFRTIRDKLRALAEDSTVVQVVVDFGRLDYFGSTALELLVYLGQQVQRLGGRLVFCNVSPQERELFRLVGVGDSWLIFASREEAVNAVA